MPIETKVKCRWTETVLAMAGRGGCLYLGKHSMDRNDRQNVLEKLSIKWQLCPPPAEPTAIKQLVAGANCDLPEAYLQLLAFSDGAEGHLDIEPYWFQIWHTVQVIECNQAHAVSQAVPGFWGFGSSGGGELLAFDIREPASRRVYMIPFIPMVLDEAVLIADDFDAFIKAMGQEA